MTAVTGNLDPQAQYGWRCEKIMDSSSASSFAKFLSDRYIEKYDIDLKRVNISKFYAATDKTILSRLTSDEAMRREALLDAYNALGFRQDNIDPALFISGGVRPSAVVTLANWFDTIWDNLLNSWPSALPKFFAQKNETPIGGSRGSGGKFGTPSSLPAPIPSPPRLAPSPTPRPNSTPTPMSNGLYSDCLEKLFEHESRGNGSYSAKNGSYMGRYQMGHSALADAGFYDTKTKMYTELAKEYGVRNDESFLGNGTAQEVAIRLYHQRLWKYICNYGFDDLIGQEKDGVIYSASGLIASVHLVGIGAFKNYIKNGGLIPKDGNGTPYTAYMRDMGGYDIDDLLSYKRP